MALPFPSAGTFPSSRGNSAEGTPCHPFQMKPDLRAASTTSVLGYTSRQPHAPSSSFTCANTADAVLPFPAQTPQEIPTNNVLSLPPRTRLLARRRSSPTPGPEGAPGSLPALPGRIPSGGRSFGHGANGASPFLPLPGRRGTAEAAPQPGWPCTPFSVPSIPGPAPRGALSGGRRPPRPPAAAAPQPRDCPRPTAIPA